MFEKTDKSNLFSRRASKKLLFQKKIGNLGWRLLKRTLIGLLLIANGLKFYEAIRVNSIHSELNPGVMFDVLLDNDLMLNT